MRLKKLEISGFKTFRDKVILEFSPGVSGIVGPNGCGKSNIVDALRWVMGEQRVKALRSAKMDDVIFNGAEGAPPLGMAEVAITMISNGVPFANPYSDYEEVTICRRIFRDGESEYVINKVPCRMLDVREFFMDTGLGARTYSLIEQNSVSTLVEAKPIERRQYIEEAAGIAKYKSRKDAALRKMEAAKQNLLRLHDIMKEVKTQLNAVSRQAKRAEQYKILKKEIKDAELAITITTCNDLGMKKYELEREKEELLGREQEISTDTKIREAAYEELKITILENEEMINRTREELYTIKNTINMKEQGIKFSQAKIDDFSTKKTRDIQEIQERQNKLWDFASERQDLKAAIADTEKEIHALRNAMSENQRQLDVQKKVCSEQNDELEEKKVSYIDIAAEKAKLRNMEANFLKSLDDIRRRQERHLKEMDDNRARHDMLKQNLSDLTLVLKEDEEEKREKIARCEMMIQDLGTAKVRLKETEADITSMKEENGRKSARLISLQEFLQGYTWCSEGIKSIMMARKQGNLHQMSGEVFLGLVADFIDVPAEYEMAVEAVLGEKLQHVVVKSQEDGIKAIDYLKQTSKGRGTFVPLKVRTSLSDQSGVEHLNDVVRLVDHVRVEDDFQEIMAYLLGDVLLISDLRSGLSLWRQNGFRGTFVTPEGDMINSQGVVTGGSENKGEKSLLANKREIAELQKEVSRLGCNLDKTIANKNALSRQVVYLEEEMQQTKASIHQLEIQINGRRKDLERFADELKRIDQRHRLLEFDNETVESEEKEALARLTGIKEEMETQEEWERVLNEQIETLKKRCAETRQDLESCEKDFMAAKVLLAAREEKLAADGKALDRLDVTKDALRREIEEKQKEMENAIVNIEELKIFIEREKEDLVTLTEKYHDLEQMLLKSNALHQEKQVSLEGWGKEIKGLKQSLDQVLRTAGEREMALREITFQMDGLKKNMEEKHRVDLDMLSRELPPLTQEELQDLAVKLDKSRTTVENFGEVNLLAINEYEELKERYDFLTSQEKDIITSLDSLQHTIERINKISRARFSDTFNAVNACFREMFSRIFPGGKGQLYLTDANDLLETGVDMDIQIPGKRTRNITLLSGGEKSLAAIALIFAILKHRPTPFLVLDEVDAALDDANVSLFSGIVSDISGNSQVIMVTHNKNTMEVAENLYGITMQKQGISTVVSVKLN